MKRKITLTNAISILKKGSYVHTFRNHGNMLFGCDYKKNDIIAKMRQFKDTLELTGENARAMSHGIAINDGQYLFIETEKDKIDIFDPINSNE